MLIWTERIIRARKWNRLATAVALRKARAVMAHRGLKSLRKSAIELLPVPCRLGDKFRRAAANPFGAAATA